jgi:hypothetical protein
MGQSDRGIANAEGMDRKTVGRLLTRPEVEEMLIRYRQQLLRLVPRAIHVYDAALLSDDERVRVAVATKLVEGLQLMARGNSQQIAEMAARAPQKERDEQYRAVINQLNEFMLDKSEDYNLPLPEKVVEIKAKIESKTSAQGKPVVSGTITEVLKSEDKKSHI